MRRLTLAAFLALLSVFFARPTFAEETCPQGCIATPKPLTCDQLKAKMAQRCPGMAPTVKIVDHYTPAEAKPCEQKCPENFNCISDGDLRKLIQVSDSLEPAPKPPPTPVPTEKRSGARALIGGGFSYGEEKNLDYHLFAGVQFAPDKHGGAWQLQIGPGIEKRDAFTSTCRIGCRDCAITVPTDKDKRIVASGVYVFP